MEIVMRNWLALFTRGKSLINFFLENKIRSVAIYGCGILGNLLYHELKNYNIEIKFCIDKTVTNFHEFNVISPEKLKESDKVDMVIIALSQFDESVYKLLSGVGLKNMDLRDIINLCYYKEILAPYCNSQNITPYIINIPFLKALNNLTNEEKILSRLCVQNEVLSENPEYLNNIYCELEEYSDEYIRNVFTQSQVIKIQNILIHSDVQSKFVNILNGVRFTHNVPQHFERTIHLLGQCITLGYGVDDSRTISSYLQKEVNEIPDNYQCFRVSNHGVWGVAGNNADLFFDKLRGISVKPNDIVILLIDMEITSNIFARRCYHNTLNKEYNYYSYLSDDFNYGRNGRSLYLDEAHLSFYGLERTAKFIFKLLQEDNALENISVVVKHKDTCLAIESDKNISASTSMMNKNLEEYSEFLRSIRNSEATISGGIVMNCNPFTNGHRYLVEYASSMVDALYIFVVEEDKSIFPFQDRMELIRMGTQDLKNVIVVPSGSFILSAITFPEYFVKDSQKYITVDTSKDIKIFASQIAPILNITIRFAGQEPIDPITRQYNQSMREILPEYNIKFMEIERQDYGGNPISASRIRALIKERSWEQLREMVPESTFKYLKEHFKYKNI